MPACTMLALNLQPIQRIENTCFKKTFDSMVIKAKIFKRQKKHCYELIEINVVKGTGKIFLGSLISPQELVHCICKFACPYQLTRHSQICLSSKYFPNVKNQEIILGINCNIIQEWERALLSPIIIEYTTPQDVMKMF